MKIWRNKLFRKTTLVDLIANILDREIICWNDTKADKNEL